MQISGYQKANFNSFDFNFKTSGGDEIKFSMYDNKTVDFTSSKTATSSARSLTLTHEYGYSFSYSGDGIDEKDRAEIAKALEEIKPSIEKFIKNVKEGEDPTFAQITNLANNLKKSLPDIKDINHKNFISDNALNLFDKILEKNQADLRVLENAKKLFDSLIEQLDSFKFYV